MNEAEKAWESYNSAGIRGWNTWYVAEAAFLAGFAAGQASRTPGTATANVLEMAKRWKQYLKLTPEYDKILTDLLDEWEQPK